MEHPFRMGSNPILGALSYYQLKCSLVRFLGKQVFVSKKKMKVGIFYFFVSESVES